MFKTMESTESKKVRSSGNVYNMELCYCIHLFKKDSIKWAFDGTRRADEIFMRYQC